MTSLLGVFPGQLARNALASLQGPPVAVENYLALGKEHAGAFFARTSQLAVVYRLHLTLGEQSEQC